MAKKKKQSSALVWIVIVILIAVTAWYVWREPAETPATPPAPVPEGAQEGDLVAINFVLAMPNGTVVDTNNEQLAQQFNVKNYVKGPFRFVIGQSSKIKGFDEAIIGMKQGETRTTTIDPSEPLFEFVVNRTRTVHRTQSYPLVNVVTRKQFAERFNREPNLNDVIVHPNISWPLKVVNVTNTAVALKSLIEQAKSYTIPGFEWKSLALATSGNDVLFRHNPRDGQTITTEFGTAVVHPEPGRINITYQTKLGDIVTHRVPIPDTPLSIPYEFEVIASTEQDFTIGRINYPPQESLVLTAEMLSWEPDVQKVHTFNKPAA